MIGLMILGVGGVLLIAGLVAETTPVDQARQRNVERTQQREADGCQGPWPARGNWTCGGN